MNEKHLKPNVGQSALIKNNKNKILLLERARLKTWCFLGDRLNEGEEWDRALLRKIKEELNIEFSCLKPFAVNIIKDDYQTKYCIYFTLDIPDILELKLSDEHGNLCWFDSSKIKDLNIEDEKIKKIVLDYIL